MTSLTTMVKMAEENLYTEAGLLKLGNVIRAEREKLGMSQRKFAHYCALSNTTIWRLESGDQTQTPEDTTLEQISKKIPFTRDQLKAIAEERQPVYEKTHDCACDLTSILNQLAQLNNHEINLVVRTTLQLPCIGHKDLIEFLRLIIEKLDTD